MDNIGSYEIKSLSKHRQNISTLLHESWKTHTIYAIIEVDVTDARKALKNYSQKKKFKISFTGWICKCVARAVSENKEINSYKIGKKKYVVFDDIDIPILVERKIDDEFRPMPYIIRKANEKSVVEITKEIRKAQKYSISETDSVTGYKPTKFENFVFNSPRIFQKLIAWIIRWRGILKKKHMGTFAVTAVGMKGKFSGWGIPVAGITAGMITLGGITKKPGVVGNKIKIREYLPLTIAVDHDLVDGAPFIRFIERLNELIENAHFLK